MTPEREKLVTDNIGLAHFIAKRFLGLPMEYDDIIAAAYMGLVKAAIGFDFTKGFAFSTYAASLIQNEILMLWRKEKKHQSDLIISMETPIDQEEKTTIGERIQDKRNLFDEVENEVALKQNEKYLCEIERKILAIKRNDPDIAQGEIGVKLGRSQSYISRMMKSMRKKMMQSA